MENPSSSLSKTICAKITNIKEMEGSSLPTVLIASISVCQSKELKCDSTFLKVHLLSLKAVCDSGKQLCCFWSSVPWAVLMVVWDSRGIGSIWTSCSSLSPSHCCSSAAALLGLKKHVIQCVCMFLCPAMYASI